MKIQHTLSSLAIAAAMLIGGVAKAQFIPPSCNFGSNVIPCPTFILGQENSGSIGSFNAGDEWMALGKAPFPAPSGDLPYGFRYQRQQSTALLQVERRATSTATSPIWDSNVLFGNVITSSPGLAPGTPRMDFNFVQQNNTVAPPSLRVVNIMTHIPASSKQITPTGLTSVCFFGNSPCFGRVGIENTNPSFTLDVNGIGRSVGYILVSDARFKKDIETIEDGISVISNLRGTTYEFNTDEQFEGFDFADGTRSGFVAQEVEEVLPHTVYTDDNGFKAVDYIAVIPYLVEGMKDMDASNAALRAEIAAVKAELAAAPASNKGQSGGSAFDNLKPAELMQNFPNPFDQETQINFYLPEGTAEASLQVFDMNGRQMRNYPITTAGDGSVTINGSDLEAGMYFYSLVANGQELATKRMILTK